jgi:iron complex outermembrane receptor protein
LGSTGELRDFKACLRTARRLALTLPRRALSLGRFRASHNYFKGRVEMNNRRKLALLTGLIALGGGAAPTFAAEPSAAGSDDFNEIIVTARRTEENLQDVPISITVLNQQQLANRNIVQASDLAATIPSLTVNSNFGSQNSSFAIRGFSQDTGTAPSVGVMFADVIAPRAASNGLPGGDGAGPGSFFDLQNVQVLKGPQGTLFGRNTTGGDILLVPQKPTSELSGYVEGGVGNYRDGEVQAVVNIPINDNLRVRAGIIHESREGYLHNVSGIGPKDFDDIDYTAGRLSVVVDILPNLENYTIATFSNSDTNGDIQKLFAVGAPSATFPFFGLAAAAQLAGQGSNFYNAEQDMSDPYSRLEQWQLINTTTWRPADNVTIKNIASYGQLRDGYNNPIFGTNFNVGGVPFNFANSLPLPGSVTAREKTISEELQFQGTLLDNRLTWQAGAYLELALPMGLVGSTSSVTADCPSYSAAAVSAGQCSDILGAIFSGALGLPPGSINVAAENLTIGESRFRDYAFYTQETYKLTDQFKITGGVRFTNDRETADSIQKSFHFLPYPGLGYAPSTAFSPNPVCTDPIAVLPDCEVSFKETSHAPTGLFDLDYTPTQDLLVYAKYSRGYREGTIAPTAPPPLNLIGPEKVDSYETGEKFTFHGPVSGTLDLSAFYNNFQDQQIQIGYNAKPGTGLGPFAAPYNVGKSRIWGIEAGTSLRLLAGLRLDVDYTYLNATIRQVTLPVLPASSPYYLSGSESAGDPLPLSPKNKIAISPQYTLPLPDSIGSVSFGATYTHTDKQITNYIDRDLPAPFTSLSYAQSTDLINLNLSWISIMGKPIDLTAFATNVTDRQYYTFIPGLAQGTQFETAPVGPPRMVGVRFKIRYR